jgi:hypothetical protein
MRACLHDHQLLIVLHVHLLPHLRPRVLCQYFIPLFELHPLLQDLPLSDYLYCLSRRLLLQFIHGSVYTVPAVLFGLR